MTRGSPKPLSNKQVTQNTRINYEFCVSCPSG